MYRHSSAGHNLPKGNVHHLNHVVNPQPGKASSHPVVFPNSRSPSEDRTYEYDTPPESYAEAVAPTTSKIHGQVRLDRFGLTPINLPSLRSERPPESLIKNRLRPMDRPVRMPTQEDLVQLWRHFHGFMELDPGLQNPYFHRADQIGPDHGFPNIGHLGEFLQPPGWEEGDQPIDHHKAHELYTAARQEARTSLQVSIDVSTNLPAHEREKHILERNRKWNLQYKLDCMILHERVCIYDLYMSRRMRRDSGGRHVSGGVSMGVPRVIEPFTRTSMEHQMTIDPQLTSGSRIPSNGNHPNSLQVARSGSSPFAQVHTGYVPQKPVEQNSLDLSRPRPYVSPTRLSFGDAGNPRFSEGLSVPPPKFQLPQQHKTEPGSRYAYGGSLSDSRSIVRSFSDPIGKTQTVTPHAYSSQHQDINAAGANQAIQGQATKRKRSAQEKTTPWYQEHLGTNDPTSIISDESMQAGAEWGGKSVKSKQTAKTTGPKPRRNGTAHPDPSVPTPISDKIVVAMMANGVHLNVKGPGMEAGVRMDKDNAAEILTSIKDRNPGNPGNPGSQFGEQDIVNQIKEAEAKARAHDAKKAKKAKKSMTQSIPVAKDNNEAEENVLLSESGEDVDDPNDKTYGSRSRAKSATPRKPAPKSNKRRSASQLPESKRSRPSLDGACEEDGSTDDDEDIILQGSETRDCGPA